MNNENEVFRSVWERVSAPFGNGESGAVDARAEMAAFIAGEDADADVYSALASMTRNTCAARILRGIAADERMHAKKLRTEYFLMYGESAALMHTAPVKATNLLTSLRARYWAEIEGEKRYREASERTESALYSRLADNEAEHAALVSSLVTRMISC